MIEKVKLTLSSCLFRRINLKDLKNVNQSLEKRITGQKRLNEESIVDPKVEERAMDRVYGALKKTLPQQVVIQDTITVAIPPAIIKKQLAAQAKLTLIFGFMG